MAHAPSQVGGVKGMHTAVRPPPPPSLDGFTLENSLRPNCHSHRPPARPWQAPAPPHACLQGANCSRRCA